MITVFSTFAFHLSQQFDSREKCEVNSYVSVTAIVDAGINYSFRLMGRMRSK